MSGGISIVTSHDNSCRMAENFCGTPRFQNDGKVLDDSLLRGLSAASMDLRERIDRSNANSNPQLPNPQTNFNWGSCFQKYVHNLHVAPPSPFRSAPPASPMVTLTHSVRAHTASPAVSQAKNAASAEQRCASRFEERLPSLASFPCPQPSGKVASPTHISTICSRDSLVASPPPPMIGGSPPSHFMLPFEDKGASVCPSSETQSDTSFRCAWDNCNQAFSTRTGLATHCSSHLAPYHQTASSAKKLRISVQCRWNGCQDIFFSLKDLAKHMAEESHVGQTPFLAKELDEEAPEKDKKKKRYACSFPSCGRLFADSSNRKKHERTHDVNRERFYCTEQGCTKSYSTKTDLNIHMKAHKGDFPHKCTFPTCNKVFVRLSELYAHERSHDNILPHLCSFCGKRFREKARLKQHEESHTPTRGQSPY
eukprot:TRINITY_DN1273_c0_g1_i1.p1 TRINITY_DN1273_c0_g1~~TRINITY_DN1273_c0_g1_i1.p1  ORF type:complete len:445 (-),score=59.23 TRINITY_DN1273_c0_g1_i1:93-1364(-)